ncbi:MAG: PAS domain S-box protein [Planctomycetes bacterium]|nr:PAS domain S-box protein [Planctomycetota bacterium]
MTQKPTYEQLTKRVEELEGALREKALPGGGERGADVFEDLPVMIHSIDSDGILSMVNKHWLKTMGYEREEVIGRKSIDFLTEESGKAEINVFLPEFMKADRIDKLPYRMVKKNGEIIDVLLSAISEKDGEGKIVKSIAVSIDVSKRKRAEDALKEATSRQMEVVKAAKIGLWDWDLQTDKVHFSAEWKKQIGYEEHEIGDGLEEFESRVHPDDWQRVSARVEHCIAEGLDDYETEFRFRHKNGSYRWIMAQGSVVRREDGTAIRMRGSHKDITERKGAEETSQASRQKFHSIVENIGIGVALISPRMEIIELNRRMREWFPAVDIGASPICYRAFNNPPREDVCDYCPTMHTLRDGTVHESITKTPQEQGERNYRIVSSPVLGAEGEVIAAIEMVEDVTDQLSMEARLRQVQKLESIGTLAGGIAHDFNNILYSIIGNTEIVREMVSCENKIVQRLDEVLRAGARAKDLVTQILSFSRQSAAFKEPVRCVPIVNETLKMLRATIPSSVRIKSEIQAVHDTVLSNPTEIHQILMNLCTNAVQAVKENEGEIEVSLVNEEIEKETSPEHSGMAPGRYLLLTVRDKGCGIDAKSLKRIFDPFFTTKAPGEGTGLGLSVVHGIIKNLGGSVTVESEPEVETVFRVRLPCMEDGTMPETGEVDGIATGRGTILVVDDEESLVSMIATMLTDIGYKVVAHSGGQEAIDFLKKNPYGVDLVITDLTMPTMTGDKLAEELLRIRPDLPVILCTGYSEWISGERIKELGIGKLLIKPVGIHTLAESVSSLLKEKAGTG